MQLKLIWTFFSLLPIMTCNEYFLFEVIDNLPVYFQNISDFSSCLLLFKLTNFFTFVIRYVKLCSHLNSFLNFFLCVQFHSFYFHCSLPRFWLVANQNKLFNVIWLLKVKIWSFEAFLKPVVKLSMRSCWKYYALKIKSFLLN